VVGALIVPSGENTGPGITGGGGVTLLLEGGGTRTWVAAVRAGCLGEAHGPSTHPVTIGPEVVRDRLVTLFLGVLDAAGVGVGDVSAVMAAHGAAATQRRSDWFAGLLSGILDEHGIRAPLLVTNDMVPVMLSSPARDVVAAIVGTGTGYAARMALSRWARVGGADYLLSDEGGGFDLGVQGLRAVVRAVDGRGPGTVLVERAQAWAGSQVRGGLVDALFERVYVAYPRVGVATFAQVVVEAASAGDEVALGLVDEAAGEILLGVRTAAARVGIADNTPTVGLSGSLVAARSPLRDRVVARIDAALAPAAYFDYAPEGLADRADHVAALLGRPEVVAALRTAFPLTVDVAGCR
jgi:N-acetylglucosamine kinase-like BadF-type ATPase